MGEIEHVGAGASPASLPGGAVARPVHTGVSFTGAPVDYVSMPFTADESWAMLPPSMRAWAEDRAGATIRDPHTGVPTVYWYCRVRPEAGGPRGAAVPATYELVMFGKRGLVVSSGTTEWFRGRTGTTAWRHRRFDVPVDPAAVRHDHREAPAETAAPSVGRPAGGPSGPGGPGPSPSLLPSRVAATFGNLPVPTQRFLLEPFTARGKRPVEADVHAATVEVGQAYRETYWCYLFDASRVAFARAQRSVPLTSGRTGPALWNGSPEAEALRRTPWAVAAWVAPVKKPGRSVAKA